MKAVVHTKYGEPNVLKIKDVKKPNPQSKEVLIKIYSTSVTTAQTLMRRGIPRFGRLFLGLTKPKLLNPGTDLAGKIEEIGKDVKNFKIGDKVFAATDLGGGSYAEYICISESDVIANKPENMNYDEAASIIEGATTALSFLRDSGKIKSGQKVLINGASGSIGTAAIQLAKYFCAEVTGVCSTSNTKMVEELGADKIIDYTKEDFTKNSDKYDVIFDTVGKISFANCKNVLTENGIFLSPVLNLKILFQMIWTSMFGKKKAIFSATGLRKPDLKIRDLVFLKKLIEEEKLKAIIDKKYKIEDVVESHKYVEEGHKKGNVVLSIVNEL